MSFDADFFEIMESLAMQGPDSDLSAGKQVALSSQKKEEQTQSFDDRIDSSEIQKPESDLSGTEGDKEPQLKKAMPVSTQHKRQPIIPKIKSVVFEYFSTTLLSMTFNQMEDDSELAEDVIKVLTRFCAEFQVPVLSPE